MVVVPLVLLPSFLQADTHPRSRPRRSRSFRHWQDRALGAHLRLWKTGNEKRDIRGGRLRCKTEYEHDHEDDHERESRSSLPRLTPFLSLSLLSPLKSLKLCCCCRCYRARARYKSLDRA